MMAEREAIPVEDLTVATIERMVAAFCNHPLADQKEFEYTSPREVARHFVNQVRAGRSYIDGFRMGVRGYIHVKLKYRLTSAVVAPGVIGDFFTMAIYHNAWGQKEEAEVRLKCAKIAEDLSEMGFPVVSM